MSEPDALIAGRYRLVRRVGTGGMGVVWEAYDERLHRSVAIKQLHPQPGLSAADAELVKNRAMREARITARLDHPHAVPVFDVVEHEGQPCLIMQFLPSTPLSGVLRERTSLPPQEAARMGAQVASALAAAHLVGIVHRDVKPGNILIAEDGTARISDFGISRAMGDATLTSTGMVHGTPAYLAPEVALGEDASFASDVFGLGATLYTMLEGAPPFGTDPNPIVLLHKVATGEFEPPKRGGALTPLLSRMLSRTPAARPSMAEVANTLGEIVTGSSPAGSGADEIGGVTATLAFPPDGGHPDGGHSDGRPDGGHPGGDLQVGEPPESEPSESEPPESDRSEAVQRTAGEVAGIESVAPVESGPLPTHRTPGQAQPPVGFEWNYVPSAAPVEGTPPWSAARQRRRFGRAALVLLVVLAVAVVAALVWPLVSGDGTTGAPSSSAPATERAAPPSPSGTKASSPSASATPSASPTSARPTPSAVRSPTAKPSASPSSTPKPTSGTPSRTELARAISDYYALMPRNTDVGWSRLTAGYQNKAGGRGSYERFWGPIERVSVSNVKGIPPYRARATVTYTFKSGRVVRERTAYGLAKQGGTLKIASSRVLSSTTR